MESQAPTSWKWTSSMRLPCTRDSATANRSKAACDHWRTVSSRSASRSRSRISDQGRWCWSGASSSTSTLRARMPARSVSCVTSRTVPGMTASTAACAQPVRHPRRRARRGACPRRPPRTRPATRRPRRGRSSSSSPHRRRRQEPAPSGLTAAFRRDRLTAGAPAPGRPTPGTTGGRRREDHDEGHEGEKVARPALEDQGEGADTEHTQRKQQHLASIGRPQKTDARNDQRASQRPWVSSARTGNPCR